MSEQRMLSARREELGPGSEVASVTTSGFPMTDWGLALSDGAESRPALERLCRVYWGPAYALVRRAGYGRDAALELIREFFAEIVTENALARAKRSAQPFRVWLLTALEEFLAGRTQGQRQAPAIPDASLELARTNEADLIDSVAERGLAPRVAYDRVLALSVLERAFVRLERAQAERGQSERFRALKPWLVVTPSHDELSAIGKSLGLGPPSARLARLALRKRLGSFVQEEVANLLERRDDTEGLRTEMDALFGALAAESC